MKDTIRLLTATVVAGLTLLLPIGGGLMASNAMADAATLSCHSSWLTAKMGRSNGAAGTVYFTLKIVNHSSSSCTLKGVPAAQSGFVAYSMHPWVAVGPRASATSIAGRGGTVVLRPGKVASVDFGVTNAGNYPTSKCAPKSVSTVRITFTTVTPSVSLGYQLPKQAVCTKTVSTSISGIVLGTYLP